jgi:hypothetical protein
MMASTSKESVTVATFESLLNSTRGERPVAAYWCSKDA